MREKTRKALKTQKTIFISTAIAIALISIGVCILVIGDKPNPSFSSSKPSLELPVDKINPQEIWMNRVESQNKLLDQKIKYLEDAILSSKKQVETAERDKQTLKHEISQLRHELYQKSEIQESDKPEVSINFKTDLFYDYSQEISPTIETSNTFSPLVEIALEEPVEKIGNVLKTIPAGTSVKALLVSSVDADCGVYSNSDPIPVKLQLLDNGHLPKKVDVLLKGGILIGSAYGNISNERVYIRLERLTQVNPNGQFIETEVAGYVSGEDGKYGMRGTVVDTSQKIVANAAVSGLFGEASDVLQSALGRWRIQNYTSANQNVNDPFVPGISGNTSNAFDMLSDYYIRRAEQVKPVIQVNAGRVVDITFTHGVEIGDLHTQEHIAQLREQSRRSS